MGELKSAWELAQEKTRGLGGLSAEEIRQHSIEEGASIAGFLVEKYLLSHNDRDLVAGVNKQDSARREVVRQAAGRMLVESVELGKDERLESIAAGVRALFSRDVDLGPFRTLLLEYRVAYLAVKHKIDQEGKALLHEMSISGSAIKEFNPAARDEWQATLAEFARPFQQRLTGLEQQALQQLTQ